MTSIEFIPDGRGGELLHITDAPIRFKELDTEATAQRVVTVEIPTAEMADEIRAHGFTGVKEFIPENAPEGTEPRYTLKIKFKFSSNPDGTFYGPEVILREGDFARQLSIEEVNGLQQIGVRSVTALCRSNQYKGFSTAWANEIMFVKRPSILRSQLLADGVTLV